MTLELSVTDNGIRIVTGIMGHRSTAIVYQFDSRVISEEDAKKKVCEMVDSTLGAYVVPQGAVSYDPFSQVMCKWGSCINDSFNLQ